METLGCMAAQSRTRWPVQGTRAHPWSEKSTHVERLGPRAVTTEGHMPTARALGWRSHGSEKPEPRSEG